MIGLVFKYLHHLGHISGRFFDGNKFFRISGQAQNGISNADDVAALQKEFSALKVEITRIANTTEFGGTKLLGGEFSTKVLVGAQASANDFIDVNIRASSGATGWTAAGLGWGAAGAADGLSFAAGAVVGASAAMARIDAAIKQVDGKRADLGAVQNRLAHNISNSANTQANVADAKSRIVDVDFAKETSQMTKNQVLQQTGSAMLAQANQLPQVALSLL